MRDFGYTCDALGRMSELSVKDEEQETTNRFEFSYNTNNGLVAGVVNTNSGVAVSYDYDVMDRPANIEWRDASTNVVRGFGYSYDAVGMITQKVTTANGQQSTAFYAYDSLDRLVSETSVGSVTSAVNYTYDLAGNRIQMVQNGETINYTIGTGNKLVSWGTNGSQKFDVAGNVTNIQYDDGRQLSMTWDSRYRLASVATNGTTAESYGYDALDRRTSISDGTTTNFLVYDGIHVIAEVDSSGNLLKSYAYGPGIDNILSMTVHGSTTSTYYYVKDHLGSVQAIVDSSGAIVESYQYDAWGNITVFDGSGNPIQASAIGNRYCWQGREISWATHLYYFRARWYDPVTGRWLSNDPIGISGGLNQYVFCENNPVNLVDPLGLCKYKRIWDKIKEWWKEQDDKAKDNLIKLRDPNFLNTPEGKKFFDEQLDLVLAFSGGGGQARGLKQVNAVAREFNISGVARKLFGKYIEKIKRMEGRGGADNFSYKQLRELAKDFLDQLDQCP